METKKRKVLIIDDEKPILSMYTTALDEFEVITASNGAEGLKLAKSEQPELIYLDIIMPTMNGLDTLTKLKESSDTKDIPVVLLTNLPEEASKDKAMSLGALDYFVKVENEPEELYEKTKKILK